jgi:hypothetical protein
VISSPFITHYVNEEDLPKPLNYRSTTNWFWKQSLLGGAFIVFIAAQTGVSVYACSCAGRGDGLFIKNRESDDNTLILPRDARGVLWWQVQQAGQKQSVKKENFAVRLLSGPRERDLDFRIVEVKRDLFLIAPIEKLISGNRYIFTYRYDTQQPANTDKVEAIVENTAFAAIKDQVQLSLSPSGPAQVSVETAKGMCSRPADVAAQVIQIDEPAAIERWRFALLFETVVDGRHDWQPRASWCENYPPGSSWRGYGTDMIFAECASAASDEIAGTKQGEHDVYMTISVPGTKLVATTKKLGFWLTCTTATSQ